jgi:hypothetical protein
VQAQSRHILDSYNRVTTPTEDVATVPPGGWLGLRADDGRAKLRKARGSRTEAENSGCPNGNPLGNCVCAMGNAGN